MEEVRQNKPRKAIFEAYFFTSASAFILLWFIAMKFISAFDGCGLLLVIFCMNVGGNRGGIKEFFGFFGALISLFLALYGYTFIRKMSQRTNSKNPWIEFFIILLLLGIFWGICSYLNKYLHKKLKKKDSLKGANRLIGSILGGIKGIIFTSVFFMLIFVTGFHQRRLLLERHFAKSFLADVIVSMEQKYKILDMISNLEIIQNINTYHRKARLEKIAVELFPDSKTIQEKTVFILNWLDAEKSRLDNVRKTKLVKKMIRRIVTVDEFKTFQENCRYYKNIKAKNLFTFYDFCELLREKETMELMKSKPLRKMMNAINFQKFIKKQEIKKNPEKK